MPAYCVVLGCANRGGRDNVRFFRIPAALKDRGIKLDAISKKRRDEWVRALKRGSSSNTFLKNARICSKHFITGAPSDLSNTESPDWIPSLHMGYTSSDAEAGPSNSPELGQHVEENATMHTDGEADPSNSSAISEATDNATMHTDGEADPSSSSTIAEATDNAIMPMKIETGESRMALIDVDDLNKLISDLTLCHETIHDLKQQLHQQDLSEESFENDDIKTKYFTGFPKSKLMFLVFKQISSSLSCKRALSPFKQYLLTLMKLRLNLPLEYLAYRFGVSPATSSDIFYTCIDVLYKKFKGLVYWPDRETLKNTMPSCFKTNFEDRIMIILDCFEIFTENPSGLATAAQCWSNYKHHETVKYLIGITPQGTIAYISEGWGGRTSDKDITENSGFLNLILPGDYVMADRGFLIEDSFEILGENLEMPVFTRGKTQLHPIDIEQTQKFANCRIHVERVIGLMRKKFQICRGPIPMSMLSSFRNDMNDLDKIIYVCSAFINLCPSIIPMN